MESDATNPSLDFTLQDVFKKLLQHATTTQTKNPAKDKSSTSPPSSAPSSGLNSFSSVVPLSQLL